MNVKCSGCGGKFLPVPYRFWEASFKRSEVGVVSCRVVSCRVLSCHRFTAQRFCRFTFTLCSATLQATELFAGDFPKQVASLEARVSDQPSVVHAAGVWLTQNPLP